MSISRRTFLGTAASALTFSSSVAGAAAMLPRTPRQSTGPFYPVELPLDSDNDLTRVAGRSGVAEGVITDVTGRVLDDGGRPVPDTLVEIWQCNAWGRYHHPRDRRNAPIDENFQGYGRMTSGDDGSYRFRTIRPVHYPGRAPHIHFAIHAPGAQPLVTQMYVAGEPANEGDFLLSRIPDPAARASLVVTLTPVGETGHLAGTFDIVLAADGRAATAPADLEWRLEALRRSV